MKRTILLSLFAVGLAFALPVLLSVTPGGRPAAATPAPAETDLPEAAAPTPQRTPVLDAGITLAVQTAEGVRDMTMAEYLPAALAGEMPAAFHSEALRAQAVALRTYALYYRENRKAAHPDADVCQTPGCCAAFAAEEELQLRWGGSYAVYAAKVQQAVSATDGQYLVYAEAPIFAVFHAASYGQTESGSGLGLSAPYLQSVSTPETAATVARLITEVEVTPEEFKTAVCAAAPEAVFGADPAAWLGAVSRNESGRVDRAVLGDAEVSGLALRQLFALRSTDFTLEFDGSCFRFTVRGYGHGAGMSQYGADLLAEGGADYAEILAHYYPGASLVIALAAEN